MYIYTHKYMYYVCMKSFDFVLFLLTKQDVCRMHCSTYDSGVGTYAFSFKW